MKYQEAAQYYENMELLLISQEPVHITSRTLPFYPTWHRKGVSIRADNVLIPFPLTFYMECEPIKL